MASAMQINIINIDNYELSTLLITILKLVHIPYKEFTFYC